MYKIMALLLFTFLVLSPQIMALDTDGLVGAWLMDESDGNTVSDSSGNGLDGKFAQGNPSWVKGKFGNGLEFGGSDMVTVDDDAALDLTSFTLSAWVKIPRTTGVWHIIASKENRNPTGRNYGIFGHLNDGYIHYSFTTNAGWKSFNAKTVITNGAWHHVVATYENPNYKLYVDGTVDAEQTPGTVPDNHDNFLFIGGCNIGNYWMSGVIDEVVLYDRALSETEINDLMKNGIENALDVKPGGKLVTTWSHIKSRSTR